MHQYKFTHQPHISATIRSARMSVQRNRYAQTAYTNFSISSKYTTNPRPKQKIVSINDELLSGRKLNHLQTQVNRRVKALKKIDQENDRLFKRINSQKSIYSQSSLNKSSVSIRSVSRCISGKNSRKELSSIKKNKGQKNKEKHPKISIEEKKIENVEEKQLQQLKKIFFGAKTRNVYNNENRNTIRHFNEKKLASTSFNIRKQSRSNKTMDSRKMGDMLHKIAEQFYHPLNQKVKKYKNRSNRDAK